MVSHASLEVAKTVLEVADVAWTAMECCHHYNHPHHHQETTPSDPPLNPEKITEEEKELESLQSENQRLRILLERNLKLLENISQSPSLLQNCPSDLNDRIISAVNSRSFLNKLESNSGCTGCKFPFNEASDVDLETAGILINIDQKEPSWWVWVTDEMTPNNIEEQSEIDNENYVVVNEEHVVDGVANFMAKCILSNPKAKELSPQELQKALTNALGGVNKVDKMFHIWSAGKMFYTLSTWGLALAGLYNTRAILKLAALGVHTSSKVVLKAL
ncbi:hypothetical protein ACH5RR_033995 [Cinchona calisaya]|uniref:Uncharacterized protein n=1 Tax=Cinchona calisaya TaxID=153742 RepID=A0ABD2YDC7_9GENT